MAGCRHAGRLSAFYDGEVVGEERRQLQEHIRHCADCAAEVERLRAISRFLAVAPEPRLSPGALQRFHRVVSGASERTVLRTARAFAMAAAGLVVVCLVWLWQGDGAQNGYALEAPEWERAAVLQQVEQAGGVSAEAQLAQWIVEDLSREDAGD